jgi:hypothetical protein
MNEFARWIMAAGPRLHFSSQNRVCNYFADKLGARRDAEATLEVRGLRDRGNTLITRSAVRAGL